MTRRVQQEPHDRGRDLPRVRQAAGGACGPPLSAGRPPDRTGRRPRMPRAPCRSKWRRVRRRWPARRAARIPGGRLEQPDDGMLGRRCKWRCWCRPAGRSASRYSPPPPVATRCGRAARVPANALRALTAVIRSNYPSSVSAKARAGGVTPATFAIPCSAPQRAIADDVVERARGGHIGGPDQELTSIGAVLGSQLVEPSLNRSVASTRTCGRAISAATTAAPMPPTAPVTTTFTGPAGVVAKFFGRSRRRRANRRSRPVTRSTVSASPSRPVTVRCR